MRLKVMSLIGAVMGLISLGLPWFSLVSTEPNSYIHLDVRGIDLLTSPGTLVEEGQTIPLTSPLLVAGAVFVLMGSLLAFLHPLGGGVTFGGGTVGMAGVFLNARSISSLGVGLSAAPSVGVFLAVAGGIVSLLGLVIRNSVQVPQPPMRVRPAALPARTAPIGADTVHRATSATRSGITTGPHSPGGSRATPGPLPVPGTPAMDSSRVCPRCGIRTLELICPNDGRATRPMAEASQVQGSAT